MFFHTLAYVIVLGTIFIIHKVRKTTLAKQKVYTTVTTVPKKLNPHPIFLPEIVGEVQSYLDIVSLGKCRLINSEWSNIAAGKLKGRIHEFEDNRPCYRPTEEEITKHLNDTQLQHFQSAKTQYLSYVDDYRLRYHIEDLMLSKSKNKKILDINPELINHLFGVDFLRSEECPFLFKMRFRVQTKYARTSDIQFIGFTLPEGLLCPIGLQEVPILFHGHVFEAVLDFHDRRAFNIRVYAVPDAIFGTFPTGDQGWILSYALAGPVLIGDLWQIYILHKALQSILVSLITYYFTFVVAANPPLRLGFLGAYIYGLAWHRSIVGEVLKFFAYTAVGYMGQRLFWEFYQNMATPKRGTTIVAGIFFFELIVINNLRGLWQAIITGDIILAFLENNLIYGLCFLQYCLWALVQKEFPKQAFNPLMLLRFYCTVILYTFYNPTPWWLFASD